MVPKPVYIDNLELIRRHKLVPGDIVECGVWRGGMMAGIAELMGRNRIYHLFDSFEGLPPAKDIDGEAARDWQKNTESPGFYDNCKAEIEFAQAAMQKSKVRWANFHKGWFNKTLPGFKFENGIAVLRMDADWYDSTMDILVNLFPQVNPNGLIILDDYYAWDGCAKALHDYLSDRKLAYRIAQYNNEVCYLIKK
ncbi:MAG: TylF/MycF/NovP-related O-methyltransferase [Salinivirgaceae bacterium]